MDGIKCLQYRTKANDVDEKGIVTVAVNGIGVKDSQGDISMPGSFNKTLKEGMNRMKWFLNHDTTQLLGVPLHGEEKDGNLIMTGQLNLKKQIGRDILEDYKLYAEAGRTLEHSIGVKAIKRDKADPAKVIEWRMFEYSTLTSWGANPQTFLVNIKSATQEQVKDAIDFLRKACMQKGYSDERLTQFDMQMDLLIKSLNGKNIVTCPYCNHQFDYDEQPEHTFATEVMGIARDYLRWRAQDCVRERMDELKPEIAAEVSSVLDLVKSHKPAGVNENEYIEKALTDITAFVRCPSCWSRVYKTDLIIQQSNSQEPPVGTQNTTEEDAKIGEAAISTSMSLKNLNSCFGR